ncbi:MAG: energy-coupling factor transporter transmembrane protein EcfT [Nitrospirae bacterium]|nr:energy-coupling factor transporter transmembrane protein EcfT [Nitrospirota bacterium]
MVYIKLFLFLSFAISLFIVDSLWYCLLIFSSSVLLYLFYPDRRMRSGLIPIVILTTSVFLSNLIMFNPGKVVYSFMGFTVTDKSVEIALLSGVRVIGLVYGAKLLTLSLGTKEIISALKRVFSPLKRIGINCDGFFDTVNLTIRLLPAVKREAIERVHVREQSGESSGALTGRAKIWMDVIVHLMVEAIKMPEVLIKKTGHNQG